MPNLTTLTRKHTETLLTMTDMSVVREFDLRCRSKRDAESATGQRQSLIEKYRALLHSDCDAGRNNTRISSISGASPEKADSHATNANGQFCKPYMSGSELFDNSRFY